MTLDEQTLPTTLIELQAEVERLRQELAQVQRANNDLQIALATIAEHGDFIEAQLHTANLKLHAEIAERIRAESTLKTLVNLITRQKSDLEIILETITEHGDVLDAQWLEKVHYANWLAISDGLTQIPNRRKFDEYFLQQWRLMCREGAPLSLLLCDIDCFKQYNDTYGHLEGDECLKTVAQVLSKSVHRPGDLVARFGGEEFIVVLPQTDGRGAMIVAQTMHMAIAQLRIPHRQSAVAPHLSISVGAATLVPTLERSPHELIDLADQMLYQAKQQGRNQIVSNHAGIAE